MAGRVDSAKRVINGTFGEMWSDGRKVAETTGLQAKIAKNKSTITLCGEFMEDSKSLSGKGTGSITLYKVDSAFVREEIDTQTGADHRHTLISKLRDPDSWGAERIALYNVSYDDVTLADWKAATEGTVTIPFTFTRAELLDTIEEA